MHKSEIIAVVHHFPEMVQSSSDLEELIAQKSNYSPIKGIIESITGIKERHVSRADEYNSTMAIAACNKLFDAYPAIKKTDIDLLIFASAGQDILEPATSHIVQKEIGTNCPVLDVTNACNSFINALQIADAFIKNNTYKNVLIATGEVSTKSAKIAVSSRDDFKQSFPGYTFGDGGTAVIVSASNSEDRGIIDFSFTANSDYWDTAIMAGGGSRFMGNSDQYFRGNGHELKIAFDTIGPDFVKSFLAKYSLTPQDINHVFVHQVSLPYLKDFMKGCEFNNQQVEQTISWCGNVAAASLPLAWSLRNQRNELKNGDKVLLIGLAGGISLGVALVQI
jgi:3-oxoacyl-[acyl-carrier-protein] synthase-3